MRTIAIHQPNFLPWLGYFVKYVRSDVFVLLDNVQITKKGGNWINRVQMLVSGRAYWLTLPLQRQYSGVLPIKEAKINTATFSPDKLLKTINFSYRKHPYFDETYILAERILMASYTNLVDFNIFGISEILSHLDLAMAGKIVRSSHLGCEGISNDLLIEICKRLDGDRYLSGDGAMSYIQPDAFNSAGLGFSLLNFEHPTYPQIGNNQFIPGLSIFDALFSIGIKQTRSLLIGKV